MPHVTCVCCAAIRGTEEPTTASRESRNVIERRDAAGGGADVDLARSAHAQQLPETGSNISTGSEDISSQTGLAVRCRLVRMSNRGVS